MLITLQYIVRRVLTPLDLVQSRPPPGIALKAASVATLHGGDESSRETAQVKDAILPCLTKALGAAEGKLRASQRRNQAEFDCKVRIVETVVAGEEVFLDMALNTKSTMLQSHRYG